MYFLFYLRTQILPIDSYILNSKSAAFQSIWLKFGQSDALYLFYKTMSANLNTPFHFKARAFFSTGSVHQLPSPTSVANKRKTNALVKNLRHDFLVERVEKQMQCYMCSIYFRREWNRIYRDVYFYTKRSNFETHLSKSFLLVQIHNLELLSF